MRPEPIGRDACDQSFGERIARDRLSPVCCAREPIVGRQHDVRQVLSRINQQCVHKRDAHHEEGAAEQAKERSGRRLNETKTALGHGEPDCGSARSAPRAADRRCSERRAEPWWWRPVEVEALRAVKEYRAPGRQDGERGGLANSDTKVMPVASRMSVLRNIALTTQRENGT